MHEPSLTGSVRDLVTCTTGLIRSEIHLAKAELQAGVKDAGRQAGVLGACAVFAVMGVSAFMAFMIIGLGQLIGNYWLSALIVSVVFLASAAIFGFRAVEKIKEDVGLSTTIDSIERDKELVDQSVTKIRTDFARPKLTPVPSISPKTEYLASEEESNVLKKRAS